MLEQIDRSDFRLQTRLDLLMEKNSMASSDW